MVNLPCSGAPPPVPRLEPSSPGSIAPNTDIDPGPPPRPCFPQSLTCATSPQVPSLETPPPDQSPGIPARTSALFPGPASSKSPRALAPCQISPAEAPHAHPLSGAWGRRARAAAAAAGPAPSRGRGPGDFPMGAPATGPAEQRVRCRAAGAGVETGGAASWKGRAGGGLGAGRGEGRDPAHRRKGGRTRAGERPAPEARSRRGGKGARPPSVRRSASEKRVPHAPQGKTERGRSSPLGGRTSRRISEQGRREAICVQSHRDVNSKEIQAVDVGYVPWGGD